MRPLLMTLDAAMVSSLTSASSVAALARTVARRGTRSYDRLVAGFGMLSRWMPGLPEVVGQLACSMAHVPFDHDDARLVARGSNVSVYLLEHEERRIALKLYRDTLGRSLPELLRSATARRAQYDLVVDWYREVGGLVAPSDVVVIPGPLLGHPVVAVVQPWVGGTQRDLFTDLSLEQLRRCAERCARFRKQVVAFAGITTDLFRSGDRLLDIVGPDNVVICGDEADCRLVVTDFGVVDLARMRSCLPRRHHRFAERVTWLRQLRGHLSDGNTGGSC